MSPLLNYTTTVDVEKTLGTIISLLAKAGALHIQTIFDGKGEPTAVAFSIDTLAGPQTFTLPVVPDRVRSVMLRDTKTEPRYKTPEQARRVAWRIAKDWLEAQIALVQTEMVSFEQVMLPYMHLEGGRTVYELYSERQLANALAPGTP